MTDPHSDPHSESVSHAHGHPSVDDGPETPFWLPALGFALFVLGGLGWAVSPPLQSATPPALPTATAAPVVPPPAPASAAPPPPAPPPDVPAPAPVPTVRLPRRPLAPPGSGPRPKKHQ